MVAEEGTITARRGAEDQAAIIAFLKQPESHGVGSGAVEVHETHGALVFLVGNVALKIKRAVAFSYMDFSTLEKRRRAIARELEINKPHAPGLYRDVVAITREPDGRLAIGGGGAPVEWALRMRRFRQQDLLAAMAEQGPLDLRLSRALADAAHAFHDTAAVARDAASAAQMRAIIVDVAHALAGLMPAPEVEAFETAAVRRLTDVSAVLARRAAAGFVRRAHGDLHLGNIVLEDGHPVLFDAIEFDERLATVDTLYDLAFLIMDLCHRGDGRAANVVLNRYLWRSGALLDVEGLAAMPLFLALRAGVRAMVTAQRAAQETAEVARRDRAKAEAYLTAARAFLDPAPATLIAVGGLSGSGKSTLAAALAPALGAAPGALHVRSDLERKALFGVAETERLPPEAYRRDVGPRVYERLLEKSRLALAAGSAVVTDAVYAEPQERRQIEAVADRLGLPFHGLWLEAPKAALMARVAARQGDASDATPAVVEQQLSYDTGPLGWTVIAASGAPEETLARAREVLGVGRDCA